ncbi:MAG: polymer-forming cytoskeletal protein [Acidobacteria bacterium]|nr:polymer-forming cytoskeletal protein [Acidobacteriota bacterium]
MWRKKKAPTSPISPTVPIASGSAGTDPVDRPVEQSLIGKSLVFKGDVSGTQDLTVNGQLEGSVSISGHTFTVGREGRVQSDIRARVIRIEGRVDGNLQGEEAVFLGSSGVVHGDLTTIRVSLKEGCQLRGRVQVADESIAASEPSEPLIVRTGHGTDDPGGVTSKS